MKDEPKLGIETFYAVGCLRSDNRPPGYNFLSRNPERERGKLYRNPGQAEVKAAQVNEKLKTKMFKVFEVVILVSEHSYDREPLFAGENNDKEGNKPVFDAIKSPERRKYRAAALGLPAL